MALGDTREHLAHLGEERERLWNEVVAVNRDYAEYQARTTRDIPVVVLERQ